MTGTILAAAFLASFVAFCAWLVFVKRPPGERTTPCPGCGAKSLESVGFLSWNTGPGEPLVFVTMGLASPRASFAETLQRLAANAPPSAQAGAPARQVGAIDLLNCPRCGGRFTRAHGADTAASCAPDLWEEMTGGTPPA